MRRAPFKLWIVWTGACRYLQAGPRSTGSNIIATERCRCTPALNPQIGEVLGQTSQRHTSQEFVAFLEEVVATQPAERRVHVILDNFSAHKTDLVKGFLRQHANVTLHFTPTYSSWLNQVESWFSKLQRDVIDRGIFTSVADLKRKILRYIRLYQKAAKPFQWKYSDVRKRIPAW